MNVIKELDGIKLGKNTSVVFDGDGYRLRVGNSKGW
jgi:hypothetical protein